MSPTEAAEPIKLNIGDVLTTAARVVGARIGPFLLIAALGAAPGSILMQLMNHLLQGKLVSMVQNAPTAGDPDAVFGMLGAMLAIYGGFLAALVVHVLLTYAAQAVIIRGSVDFLLGKAPDLSEMVRTTGPRLPSVMGIVLTRGMLQFALMMPGLVISMALMMGVIGAAGGSGAGEGAAAAAGLAMICGAPMMLLLMVAPAIMLSIVLFVSEPVAIHDKLGPVDSIARSISLTRKNRLRIFGLMLIVGSLFVVVGCGLGMFSSLVTLSTGGLDMSTGMMRSPSVIGSVVGALVNVALYAVQAITYAPLAAVIYGRLTGLNSSVDAERVAEVFA